MAFNWWNFLKTRLTQACHRAHVGFVWSNNNILLRRSGRRTAVRQQICMAMSAPGICGKGLARIFNAIFYRLFSLLGLRRCYNIMFMFNNTFGGESPNGVHLVEFSENK